MEIEEKEINPGIEILVVEDSPTQAIKLEHMLESHYYSVSVAHNGEEALLSIKRSRPTIVISDVLMPEMDGYELCRRIKSSRDLSYIPVILLTQLSDPRDIIRGLECGADHFITKPYNEAFLLSHIQYIFINRELRKNSMADLGIEIFFAGQKHHLTSDRMQILDLLFSTYEAVVQKNSELNRINQALKDANKKLKEFDRLKSDFLSTVSDEIQSPVKTVRDDVMCCLGGRKDSLTKKQKVSLSSAIEHIDSLTHLVADLLDISKIEAGRIQLQRKSIDLCQIAKRVKEGFEPAAIEKKIEIQTRFPEKPITLFADGEKIAQIFNNLISNAVRFTESGGTVTIEVKDRRDFVECSVSDTGIGIDEKDMPKLFSKFEQFKQSEKSECKGIGLGLAIAKGLVERHGGQMWAKSQVGKETTFWFTLKKVPIPKILIVDDGKNQIDMIKEYLIPDNYRFTEAYDGLSAFEKAKSEYPSVIIMDMKPPGMNGYELLGRLKQDDRTLNIPLILMSNSPVDRSRLDQLEIQNDVPIMDKPVEKEALRKKIQEMLTE